MSPFGEESIEAARWAIHAIACGESLLAAREALDAAIAALDRDELTWKAARAIAWADTPDAYRYGDPSVYMPLARAALRAVGLLPGDTASADQREGER